LDPFQRRYSSVPRVGALVSILLAASAGSTQADAQTRSFEVASVRQNLSGSRSARLQITRGGELRMINSPLGEIVRRAYGIYPRGPRPYTPVENEPDWIDDRFDIIAKAVPPPTAVPQGQLGEYSDMLQTLLAERFKLRVRWTTREQPVYLLILARDDGQLGPGLTRPKVSCSPSRQVESAGLSREEIAQLLARCGGRGTATSFQGVDTRLSTLIPVLVSRLARPVIDRTGLEGTFDISLTWRPDGVPSGTQGAAWPDTPLPTVDLAAPRLIDAVEEQLGLMLVPASAPTDALVIEYVERLVPD
jgi:uncharacterized protein (TIGR03435 family)